MLSGFGGYLKDADADRILHDVEDLGRRQPWAVIAGGLAVGFMASRFLKASSSERYRSSTGSEPPGIVGSILERARRRSLAGASPVNWPGRAAPTRHRDRGRGSEVGMAERPGRRTFARGRSATC